MPRKAKIDNVGTVKATVDIFSQPTNQTDKVVETSKKKSVTKKETKPKKEKSTSTGVQEEKKVITAKSKCKCDICGKEIYTSPFIIRLTALTARASWHRDCCLEQLTLCDECSKELNQHIDKWIIKQNPKLKKFIIEKSE